MSTVSVYAFLSGDAEGADYDSYTTQVWAEALEYGKDNKAAIIELEYEFSDSQLVFDFRPGHAIDGTPIEVSDG